jgi:molybdate transport system ATP-binding protein
MSGLEASVRKRLGSLELDLQLDVEAGSVALVGPNGAGKTTALLALLGIVRPHDGRIRLGSHPLFDAAAGLDVPTEERGIAYLPQDYALFPHLTACQNVEFALAAASRRRPAGRRRQEARVLLERLGVGGTADRRPATLSGGERQRVALARALAREPRLLLFDEPFAALDAHVRGEVRSFLRERLAELALPAVVVTHDRADVEALGVPVLVLEGGRVVQRGSLAELAARPATDYVARFCDRNQAPDCVSTPARADTISCPRSKI